MAQCTRARRDTLIALAASGAILACAAPALGAQQAAYVCDSGRKIDADYPSEGGARLAFDGRVFFLYPVRSASGARYATEQGLSPDRGLQWWIKGDEATLSEMLMDHTAPQPKPLDTCRAQRP